MRTAVYSSYSVYPVVEARKHKPKSHKDADNTARRITSNVKQNLKFVKLKEQRNVTMNTPKPVTRFRRKKGDNEIEETDLKIEPGEEEEDTNFDNTTHEWETGEVVVLVDAYNLCGQWEKLKPDFSSGRLSTARDKLIDYLVMYNEVREFKVVAVFDAVKSGRRTHKENIFGVDIIYTGGIEADDWILGEVESLKKAGSPVLVITSDIFMKSELLLLGASVWSCATFVTEIQDAELEYSEIIKRDRVREKKSKMPVKYDMPLAVPALKSLKKKLVDEDLSNAPESETSSTPDPTATDLHSSNQSNVSLRKKSVQVVKLKKRGYGSFFHTMHDLKRRIS
ncbi:hypothetical protein LUZ61_012903 [Rhynchospora tenuis]|uniref:NYN domain-containing protein n=1 Tax=Rhynchospora tenuis TaxID=198213 RepID=A0AAD6F1Z9_9POAL|nr:hypothetical protein LUZ61_012903 [Rhynchospora tenuis]